MGLAAAASRKVFRIVARYGVFATKALSRRKDPFTSANQNVESYWKRVKAVFDERRLLDPYFKALTADRNVSAMSHRWHMIQHACNKWHVVVEEVLRVHISGTNFADQTRAMITAYGEDNDDIEFKFVHVFVRLETCDKWKEVQTALAKANALFDPKAVPTPLLLAGPSGTRKPRQ
ncbi:hypothetical protein QYE76_005986 [Lolium multiflorum]|uniref:Uncharacterized protein n=1 Tax=Lolium multiflorum TaxID=4521 RepID=A0AAD8RTV5_LOLMU|nr:hypothetical protein QYE76_005986 [Lolium multiflorum]